MRKGYSLITAIFMMVVIAVVGSAILMLSSFSSVQKSQAFMHAQAELLARSATEYAIYQIQKDQKIITGIVDEEKDKDEYLKDQNETLLTPFRIYIPAEQFNVHIRLDRSNKEDKNVTIDGVDYARDINGTVMIDVTVEAKDVEKAPLLPIRFVRRTVQQI